jgi:hypothetical protein
MVVSFDGVNVFPAVAYGLFDDLRGVVLPPELVEPPDD